MIIKLKRDYLKEYWYIMKEIHDIRQESGLTLWQRQVQEQDRWNYLAEYERYLERKLGASMPQLRFDTGTSDTGNMACIKL